MTEPTKEELLALTSQIVAAHVGNNSVQMGDLPSLIQQVYGSLSGLCASGPEPVAPEAVERPVPAVSIKKSVTSEYLICLEDGKKLKMLKRHLQTAYGMTPEQYRERWNLPSDYPMVAPDYAVKRSVLAKSFGLGTQARSDSKKSGRS